MSFNTEATYEHLRSSPRQRLKVTEIVLPGYTRDKIHIFSVIDVYVEVMASNEPTKRCRREVFVVGGAGHDLFRRSRLAEVILDWPKVKKTIYNLNNSMPGKDLERIWKRHSNCILRRSYARPAVRIHAPPVATPRVCSA